MTRPYLKTTLTPAKPQRASIGSQIESIDVSKISEQAVSSIPRLAKQMQAMRRQMGLASEIGEKEINDKDTEDHAYTSIG